MDTAVENQQRAGIGFDGPARKSTFCCHRDVPRGDHADCARGNPVFCALSDAAS
jgi:hypothetical protein